MVRPILAAAAAALRHDQKTVLVLVALAARA
jgi:hypothetical protein